jgi:hypothetical protein
LRTESDLVHNASPVFRFARKEKAPIRVEALSPGRILGQFVKASLEKKPVSAGDWFYKK